MSQYTTTDLEYSLSGGYGGEGLLDTSEIKSVLAAWGVAAQEYADWTGGFLLELKDGRFAYLSGWCDSSGWGCQDGASIKYFDNKPQLDTLVDADAWTKPEDYDGWDENPTDLNSWIKENQ